MTGGLLISRANSVKIHKLAINNPEPINIITSKHFVTYTTKLFAKAKSKISPPTSNFMRKPPPPPKKNVEPAPGSNQ
jgi:hypothetical protein